jgi:hypothetical protein
VSSTLAVWWSARGSGGHSPTLGDGPTGHRFYSLSKLVWAGREVRTPLARAEGATRNGSKSCERTSTLHRKSNSWMSTYPPDVPPRWGRRQPDRTTCTRLAPAERRRLAASSLRNEKVTPPSVSALVQGRRLRVSSRRCGSLRGSHVCWCRLALPVMSLKRRADSALRAARNRMRPFCWILAPVCRRSAGRYGYADLRRRLE